MFEGHTRTQVFQVQGNELPRQTGFALLLQVLLLLLLLVLVLLLPLLQRPLYV